MWRRGPILRSTSWAALPLPTQDGLAVGFVRRAALAALTDEGGHVEITWPIQANPAIVADIRGFWPDSVAGFCSPATESGRKIRPLGASDPRDGADSLALWPDWPDWPDSSGAMASAARCSTRRRRPSSSRRTFRLPCSCSVERRSPRSCSRFARVFGVTAIPLPVAWLTRCVPASAASRSR